MPLPVHRSEQYVICIGWEMMSTPYYIQLASNNDQFIIHHAVQCSYICKKEEVGSSEQMSTSRHMHRSTSLG